MFSHIDPRSIFIIIPAFNEHYTLQLVANELQQMNYSLVVVDDGSTINVYNFLENNNLYYLRHTINLGQGAALQTGIEFALAKGAAYIVTFDADGQHNAKDIETLIQTLIETHSDIALGSRFIQNNNPIPFQRKILLKIARFINYFFTGMLLTDAHNGLRAMTAATAEKIQLRENRMAHATEILSVIKRKNIKYIEVPVRICYTDYSRKKGQTTMSSFRILFDLFLNKIFR